MWEIVKVKKIIFSFLWSFIQLESVQVSDAEIYG